MKKTPFLFVTLLFFFCGKSFAQKEKMDLETYEQALSYTWSNLGEKVYNLNPEVKWFTDDQGIWFVHTSDAGRQYREMGFRDNNQKPLFDHQKLAAALAENSSEEIKAEDLKLENLKVSKEELEFRFDKKTFVWNRKAEELSEKENEKEKRTDGI
jgi:dipeptidyl-peptidase 4